jgi:hypothetical protein
MAIETLPDDTILLRQLLRNVDRSVVANAAGAILSH